MRTVTIYYAAVTSLLLSDICLGAIISSFGSGYNPKGALGLILEPLEAAARIALPNIPLEFETKLNSAGLIEYLGFPVDTYDIETEDGYILRVFRMKYTGTLKTVPYKGPILIQHGLLCSSSEFLNNFPHQSSAYILWKNGYDVWISNSRGNTYCRNHTSLNADKDPQFWDFSWDEMARYDLTVIIDYMIKMTNQKQIYYMGHSQGTTIMFALLSSKPEYNQKIKAFFALAPVTDLKNIKFSLGKILGYIPTLLDFVLNIFGIDELLPQSELVQLIAGTVCNSPVKSICNFALESLFGYNSDQLNQTRWPVYGTEFPAGTSGNVLIHWAQNINVGRFKYFDHGPAKNLLKYGQATAPDYDLTKVTAPVALFYTMNDPLSPPLDNLRLSRTLRNLIGLYQIGDERWAHMDLVWGIDSGPKICPIIFDIVNNNKIKPLTGG